MTSNGHEDHTIAKLDEHESAPAEPPKKKRRVQPETNGHATPTEADSTATVDTIKEGRRPKKVKKRVSFSADTKLVPESPALSSSPEPDSKHNEPPAGQKKTRTKSKHIPERAPVQKSNASLDYLNRYYTNRAEWKFNKNRETWILKHVLSENDIPREYDIALAKYIHGLQGTSARERLQSQSLDLLRKERENTSDVHSQNEGFYGRFRKHLEESTDPGSDEEGSEEYVAWLRQKSRARLLLWSLGFDDQALDSIGAQPVVPNGEIGGGHTNGDSKAPQKEKKRKNRTAVVDYDTSSSDSSSSSSESDSDSDSSNEESDREIVNHGKAEEETSSSGSSSDGTDSESEPSSDSDNED